MIFLIIAGSILVVGLIFSFVIVHNFKVPSQTHHRTPMDEGVEFEEVNIPTKNNKKLFGWWINAEEKAPSIILVHGWGRNVGRLMPYIKNLQGKGFNILGFDSRHNGNSDPDNFSSMIKFAEDISACIDFIEKKPTAEKGNIFLIGLSIGGAASIYAAANDFRIKKIVTVGAPSNPAHVMALHIRKKHIPQPVIWIAFRIIEHRIGKRFSEISSCKNIWKTKAQVLIIHGTADKVVPFSQAEKILQSANPGQAEIWAIEGKGHSNCHYEVGFWDRIIEFLFSNEITINNNQASITKTVIILQP